MQVFHKHEVLCIKNGTKKLRITVIYYTTWNLSIIFKKKTKKKMGFNLSLQFLDAQEILKIVVLKTRRRLTNHGKSKPRICFVNKYFMRGYINELFKSVNYRNLS